MERLASKRYYARMWREHVAPALAADERITLMGVIDALPESVAPMSGRLALYQAMARRRVGSIKIPEPAPAATPTGEAHP